MHTFATFCVQAIFKTTKYVIILGIFIINFKLNPYSGAVLLRWQGGKFLGSTFKKVFN